MVEREGAEEDERLLALIGCIQGLVIEVDADARYLGLWADDPRVLAVPKEQAIGRTINEVLGEEYGAPLTALVRRVFDSGQTEQYEYSLQIAGETRWFLADVKRVRAGDTHTVVSFARDISERKRAEQALHTMEERYRLAAHATNDVLYDHDLRTGNAHWGAAARGLIGIDEEVTTATWFSRIHPEDIERLQAEFAKARAGTQDTWTTRYRLRRSDGSFAELLSRGFFVREAGVAVRCVGSVADMTQLNRLQQQLVQSDRLAAIGVLAAGVGHEINNPLSYVLGNIEYALDMGPFAQSESGKALEADVRVALGEAREGARRIAEIVKSLKLFSQHEEVASHEVQVETVIERSIKMAENQIRHRARLVRDFSRVPSVKINEGQLGQVCLNLLINAAQAINDGNTDANEIRVATSVDALGRVVIAVSDTGPGIRPEHLPRIFDPFFTTKANGMGQGIGLSVCLAIVQSMGGELTVTSDPGAPTTFRITLPAPATTQADTRPPAASDPPAQRPRMLVIDDDAAVGRYIARVLRSECDVTTVESSCDALRHLDGGERFDVVLCDVMMPEMNGVELYDVLREQHADVLPHLFFMTGGAFTTKTAEFLDTIPDRALEKPIDQARLRALLRS
ncbi:MAG: hybrid sensor histidine kinase/response regulator [Labilithrix sp.]|nr:hybrid sensor histidine kinase/response regulator [Labilithrix sp.]